MQERLGALCDTLDKYLPRFRSYHRPGGGYFVWISLPVGTSGEQFINWCQDKYKVSTIPGVRFSNTGESENSLRLSIAFHQTNVLKKTAKSLCTALLQYVSDQVGTIAADLTDERQFSHYSRARYLYSSIVGIISTKKYATRHISRSCASLMPAGIRSSTTSQWLDSQFRP